MKSIHAKYLILLLMMSFGSASIHALVDHDNHGCSACILNSSHEKQFPSDLNDTDSNSDLALLTVNNFLV